MKFIIDRLMWDRDDEQKTIYLKHPETGKMCCVGFYLCALGLPPQILEGKVSPQELPQRLIGELWPNTFFRALFAIEKTPMKHDSEWGLQLTITNDTEDLRDRESRLINQFSEQGVEVEFIN